MTTILPDVAITGVVSGSNIVAQIRPRPYAQYLTRQTISGPSPSQFDVYIGAINDSCRVSTTTRGDRNTAGGTPIRVPAGSIVYGVWSKWTVSAVSTWTVGLTRE